MLSIRALCRSYREGGRLHRVLDHADADIASGEAVAIVGRSGSGKSTLLNLISGIDRVDSGAVAIDGEVISALPEPQRTLFRRRHLGFIYQFFNLVPTLNVEENVRLVLELNGVRGANARRRTRDLLEQVGLSSRLQSPTDSLSGGEQQRVAIARALVHQPKLLLADEPTGNLDEETAFGINALLSDLVAAHGATLVLATHGLTTRALAHRVLELKDGRLRNSVP